MELEHRMMVTRRILENQSIGSQQELVAALTTEGILITQATASRDLSRLRAVKVRDRGVQRYVIPDSGPSNPEANLARVLSEHALSMIPSGNLMVLRTHPGAAHVVAGAVDAIGRSDIIGSIAGDDTVLLVLSEAADATVLVTEFESLGVEV